jgi:hypothetical protein
MATLLRGGNGTQRSNGQSEAQPQAPKEAPRFLGKRALQVSLFAADIVLCALVVRLAFISHHHLSSTDLLFGMLALVAGAWLSCVALWLEDRSQG